MHTSPVWCCYNELNSFCSLSAVHFKKKKARVRVVNPGAGQTTKPRPPEKVKQTQVLFVCGNFVESKQTNRRFYSRRFVITSCGSICFLLLCAWMCTRSCYLLGTFSDTNTDHVRTSCPNGDLIQDIMISEVLVRFRGKV